MGIRVLLVDDQALFREGLRTLLSIYPALEVVGDDMGMRGIKNTLQAVQQRYAYHTVLEQTNAAGFELVEERTGRDNVIRLTVRRWS